MKPYKANQKVWVICADGNFRPARTCNGKVWAKRSEWTTPVWFIAGNGYAGWDHAVHCSAENIRPRTENFGRNGGTK